MWIMQKIREWAICQIIKLVDIPNAPPPDEKMDGILADLWLNVGFRQYMAQRNEKIKHYLSGGDGMKELSRDDYIRAIGQRIEHLIFANLARRSYNKRQEKLTKVNKKNTGQ